MANGGDGRRAVRQIDYRWITVRDGTRLAARIWLPEDAAADPVPGILEAVPYRLGDGMAPRDVLIHPYWAAHGYACVRVDLRGSGDSEGVLGDEYLPQEQEDLLEVIAWIAAQPWCTGAVGMTGISWGGFNSLQLAARRPPALKAIITLMSTDDRYADDVHYKGGCVMGTDLLHWSSCMLHWQCQPPNEDAVGAGWREQWLQRLEANSPWVHTWIAHQRRDAYWKHGSVCEEYGDIEIPVYAVGGWADGYTNTVLRLLEGLSGPRKGLIGPWGHAFPHVAAPGPAVGFLREALRWWDHWLKGADTGVMDEPMLRAWMQEWDPPAGAVADKPGRWVAEEEWPAARLTPRLWRLDAGGALLPREGGGADFANDGAGDAAGGGADAASGAALTIRGSQLCGADAGAWCAEGQPSDRAPDQRAAEGQSLCFTSAPLAGAVEILGRPLVTLRLAADRPLVLVAVRLDDVAPDGVSLLVAQQVLNLSHRGSHERPEPLEPGRECIVSVELDAIAHAFPAGHRLRLAVSPTYWPLAWPSPEPVTLSVFAGRSTLELPVRPPRAADTELPPFSAPETPPGLGEQTIGGGPGSRSYVRDLADGSLTWDYQYVDGGNVVLPNDWEDEEWNRVSYFIREDDPLSAAVRVRIESVYRRGTQGRFHITSEGQMTCDATTFFVEDTVEVCEGEEGDERRVFCRTWRHEEPRDLC
ncbi:MAG TPA: CocE/NonD family hydrolase [Thermoleophilia bacterium]|nr:CocE/NonD family hydrolase [Thermoleophilia bacterium]